MPNINIAAHTVQACIETLLQPYLHSVPVLFADHHTLDFAKDGADATFGPAAEQLG